MEKGEVSVLFRKPSQRIPEFRNFRIVAAVFAIYSCTVLLPCADGHTPYTNSWAVEVHGGRQVADKLAREHGFFNAGEVGKLTDIYHFILNEDSRSDWGITERDIRSLQSFQLQEKRFRTIALRREDNVGYVQQQQLLQMEKRSYQPPADPAWTSQWSLKNTGQTRGPSGLDLNVEPVWMQGISGAGVVVSVVDDGLEARHPDLQINFDTEASRDFIENDDDPTPRGSDYHGTACAGLIGMARNGVCGVGVAPGTRLGGLRLNLSYTFDLTQATILGYHDNYVDVYSNSWGPMETGFSVDGPEYLTKETLKIETEQGRNLKGSIYVFASGNGGSHHDSCAADGFVNSIYTIAVGSADQNGGQAYYDEDCSAKMAVTFSYNSDTSSAEGKSHSFDQLHTTSLNSECSDSFTGTSASAPLVSGVIALALEANPDLTWRDVQYLIAYTSNPDILTGDDWVTNAAGLRVSHHFGFGAIDAEAMVTRARHWTNVPSQVSQSFSPQSTQNVPASGSVVMEFSVDNYRWGFDTVQFLEHVVLTISLKIRDYPREYSPQDFFLYRSSVGNDTVRLIDWLRDPHPRRGDIQIELTSPQGTRSMLLPYRDFDFVNLQGYQNWPFMSVHYWGENPTGTWTLRVNFRSTSGYVSVDNVDLTLYGTTITPESVHAIPSQCDNACARGCSGEGPENCDVCRELRVASTLECVEECPPGYKEYQSYCLCDSGDCSSDDNQTNTDSDTSNDENGLSLLWILLITSASVIVLILVFVIVAFYFAVQLTRQKYRKKRTTSFVRLQENIYTAVTTV